MTKHQRRKSNLLKFAIFATGLSGIVAEYCLATLASYFLYDTVVQWTLIVSIMLFSMGLGSQISRLFKTNLLVTFIFLEFILSVLTSYSAMICYIAGGFTKLHVVFIYGLGITIGLLIGMEIPLVTRINEEYEELKENISSVMAVDYFGSLIGGIFFAVIGLPRLGMTYTPVILGIVNFIVASLLFFRLKSLIHNKHNKRILAAFSLTIVLLILGSWFAKPLILYGEQKRYKQKVVFEKQSRYQKIVITQWKDSYWLFINGNQQLSTYDEHMYHEPLVHPIMELANQPKDVLVLGGGDGCAVRDILKHQSVEVIDLVDLDSVMTNIGKYNPIFTSVNHHSLSNEKVTIYNRDAYDFLENEMKFYDVIIIDLPDPKTLDLNKLYSKEFYSLCHKMLRPNGFIITQAGSPMFAEEAFICIDKTLDAAGFSTIKMHNNILTLGEWGWVLGSKNLSKDALLRDFNAVNYENIDTKWITNAANSGLISFGKPKTDTSIIIVNSTNDPILYRYYLYGRWDLY